jgi:hypothetical protein
MEKRSKTFGERLFRAERRTDRDGCLLFQLGRDHSLPQERENRILRRTKATRPRRSRLGRREFPLLQGLFTNVAFTTGHEEVGPDRRAGRSFCPVTTRTARRSVPTLFTVEGQKENSPMPEGRPAPGVRSQENCPCSRESKETPCPVSRSGLPCGREQSAGNPVGAAEALTRGNPPCARLARELFG